MAGCENGARTKIRYGTDAMHLAYRFYAVLTKTF